MQQSKKSQTNHDYHSYESTYTTITSKKIEENIKDEDDEYSDKIAFSQPDSWHVKLRFNEKKPLTPDDVAIRFDNIVAKHEEEQEAYSEKDEYIYSDKIEYNHHYLMNVAKIQSVYSEDPHTQVGAVIYAKNSKRIGELGLGYNSELKNCDYLFDWFSNEKYDYIAHAELNAIIDAIKKHLNLDGSTIYITLSPCKNCIKMLIQFGIKRIFFLKKYHDFDEVQNIAKCCNIELIDLSQNCTK